MTTAVTARNESKPHVVQPATETKDQRLLRCPFRGASFELAQRDDLGNTTGGTLWLSAQVLAAYIALHYTPSLPRSTAGTDEGATGAKRRVIELGSGIGMTALALASLGYEVLATDVDQICDTLLRTNIDRNRSLLPIGSLVQCEVLDWTWDPADWPWNTGSIYDGANLAAPPPATIIGSSLGPPFHLIVTADTVYHPDLVTPLLRSIHALATHESGSRTRPVILIGLERRDPAFIDSVQRRCTDEWGFIVHRIPAGKVRKAVEKILAVPWTAEEWGAIEIWQLKLSSKQ